MYNYVQLSWDIYPNELQRKQSHRTVYSIFILYTLTFLKIYCKDNRFSTFLDKLPFS